MISFGNGSMFVQEKRRHVSVVLGAVFYICQLGQFDQLYCSDHLDPDRLLCPLVLSATEKYVLSCLTKRAVPFPLLSFSVWSPNLKYKLTVTRNPLLSALYIGLHEIFYLKKGPNYNKEKCLKIGREGSQRGNTANEISQPSR